MIENQLKKILKIRRINQVELAELTGLSRQTINTLYNGGDTKLSTIQLLSQKLSVPIIYWFQDEEPPKETEPKDIQELLIKITKQNEIIIELLSAKSGNRTLTGGN